MSPPASWAASEASSSSVVATVRSRRDRASTSSPRSSSVLSGPAPLPFALVLMTASPTCDDVEPVTARRHAVGSRFGEEHQECQDGSTAFQPLGLARRPGIWGAAVQPGAPTPHLPLACLAYPEPSLSAGWPAQSARAGRQRKHAYSMGPCLRVGFRTRHPCELPDQRKGQSRTSSHDVLEAV